MGERLEEAKMYLRNALAEGPVDSEVVRRKAAEAGISEKTLKRAKAALGVGSSRAGSWCSLWHLSAEHAAPSEVKPEGALPAKLPAASRGIAWLRENPEAVADAVRENRKLLLASHPTDAEWRFRGSGVRDALPWGPVRNRPRAM